MIFVAYRRSMSWTLKFSRRIIYPRQTSNRWNQFKASKTECTFELRSAWARCQRCKWCVVLSSGHFQRWWWFRRFYLRPKCFYSWMLKRFVMFCRSPQVLLNSHEMPVWIWLATLAAHNFCLMEGMWHGTATTCIFWDGLGSGTAKVNPATVPAECNYQS